MINRDIALSRPSRWDAFGAAASLMCAVHCGLAPLAIAVAPVAGVLGTVDHDLVHAVVAAVAPPTAVFALARGYAAHRRQGVLLLGALGLFLIAAARLHWVENAPLFEGVIGAGGGLLLCAAHIRNRRLCIACSCSRGTRRRGATGASMRPRSLSSSSPVPPGPSRRTRATARHRTSYGRGGV